MSDTHVASCSIMFHQVPCVLCQSCQTPSQLPNQLVCFSLGFCSTSCHPFYIIKIWGVWASKRDLDWFVVTFNDGFGSWNHTQDHFRPIIWLIYANLWVCVLMCGGLHPRVLASDWGLRWFATILNDGFGSWCVTQIHVRPHIVEWYVFTLEVFGPAKGI